MVRKFKLIIFILFILTYHSFAQASKIYVVFRNDDPSAISDAEHEKRIMEIFERYQIPQTFGIIPNVVEDCHDANCRQYHLLSENQEMLNLLKKWCKEGLIEIALHGYTHQTNPLHPTKEKLRDIKEYGGQSREKRLSYLPVNPEGYSEFRGLSYEEQLQRIFRGKQLLETWFGALVTTFILPWNSHDENTIRAAKEAGIKLVSSSLESYNNPPTSELYNEPLFIQHTIGLDEIDKSKQALIARLDKFRPVLIAARQFTGQNNKSVLIIVLYHSWTLKSPEDFQLLEEALNEATSLNEVEFMTMEQLSKKFQTQLSGFAQIKKATESTTEKVNRLLSYLKIKSPLNINEGFVVISKDYYLKERKFGYVILGLFYICALILGVISGKLLSFLLKLLRLIKKDLIKILYFVGIFLFIFYLIASLFGFFGLEKGFGITDSLLAVFLGTSIFSALKIYDRFLFKPRTGSRLSW